MTTRRERKGGRKTRARRFSVGDLVRIPVGLLFIYLSIVAITKAIGVLAWEPVSVFVTVAGILVGLLFIGIGLAMSVGPFLGKTGM